MTAGRLRQFLDQVQIVKGLKILTLVGDSYEADKMVETLVRERAELESVEIINSECTDNTLRLLLHNSKIKIVQLRGESITGEYHVPPFLATSSVIKDLNLSGCSNLSSSGLVGLLNKIGETLKNLDIRCTSVSFSNVGSLTCSFPVLEKLNLSQCFNLTDAGIMGFLNKTGETLKILNLSGTSVSFSNVGSLTCSFPMLEKLNLSEGSNLTEAGIIGFLNKTGETLKNLDLRGTYVSFSNVGSLTCSFPVLEKLNLSQCFNLTDAGIMGFLNKTGETQKILNLNYSEISFSNIGSLTSSFPVLEELNLSECSNLTDAGIMGFLNKTGETLKILNLSGTSVSFSNVGSLTCSFPMLEKLKLLRCENLTDAGIIGFLNKTGETLKILDLSITSVSFSNVGSLTSRFPLLEELFLSSCSNLTDAGIIVFINKTGETLKILDLSNTTDSFSHVGSLTRSFPVLEELNLYKCDNMTEAGIMGFLNKTGETLKIIDLRWTAVSFSNVGSLICSFPVLKELNLSWCSNLTDTGIMGFLNKTGETLKILDLRGTSVSFSSFSNVGSLTSSFPLLEELYLEGCSNLTEAGTMGFLNKTGESLKILNLSVTSVSFSHVGSLTSSFPVLEELILYNCDNMTEAGVMGFLNQTRATRANVNQN